MRLKLKSSARFALLLGSLGVFVYFQIHLSNSSAKNRKEETELMNTYGENDLRKQVPNKLGVNSFMIGGLHGSDISENGNSSSKDEEPAKMSTQPDIPVPSYFNVNMTEALLLGHERDYKAFVCIGIVTVQRQSGSYLNTTIRSLLDNLTPAEKDDVVIVIFLADTDFDLKQRRAKMIEEGFKREIDSGLIRVIHAPTTIYPELDRLPRLYNDSSARVHWRSKQNIDFAYLFLYCKNISTYYLHLEDDVISATNFFSNIKTFIGQRNLKGPWFMLHFSGLGFIGKLFHSKDLKLIANHLTLFYAYMPGDLLITKLLIILGRNLEFRHKPSLFQHIGILSSLENKQQKLKDKDFKDKKKISLPTPVRQFPKVSNPDAIIVTNMDQYKSYIPANAYQSSSNSFFWARPPHVKDVMNIVFKKREKIHRIYVATGKPAQTSTPQKPFNYDKLQNATVLVSDENSTHQCDNFKVLGHFRDGIFDSDKILEAGVYLKCVSFLVTGNQTDWVQIREIAIFRDTDNKSDKKDIKLPPS